jgi:hypothetical protein
MVEYWKHRKSGTAPSESQLEREHKRTLAKLYPSSTDELVRVAAESNIKPRRLPPGGSNEPSR